MARLIVAFVAAATLVAMVSATCTPINDFCVADPTSPLLFDGLACKSPGTVKPEEFAFRGFRAAADTKNPLGIGIIPAFAGLNYAALNTLRLALAKFNYAKGGLVPPHTHPRASEVITVAKGEVHVGFVDTAGKLFAVTLKRGDVFVFPVGLIHFQLNVGTGHAETVSVLNHQNPGVQLLGPSVFGSNPPMKPEVLAKAFMTTVETVKSIQAAFAG